VGRLPAEPGVAVLVVDPTQPTRAYAAGAGGVSRSDDAGQTWQLSGRGLPSGPVRALALDPHEPKWLYAAMSGRALYVSENGADTWYESRSTEPHG